MMFDDYEFLNWYYHDLNEKSKGGPKTKLHKHLEWVLRRGQTRKPKMLCLYCKVRPVTRFSIIFYEYDISIGTEFTCCDDEQCKDEIDSKASGNNYQFLPFHFIVLKRMRSKAECKEVGELFRQVYELPKPLTRQRAFEFFNED
jgi:hypothetical protein